MTKWFCQVLNYYYDHLDDAEKNNVSIIDYIAHLLKNIRAVETLPILEKIYKRYEIPTILVKGGIKELKKEMPHAEQSESLDFETIEDLIGVVYNDEWDDENFDEDFDDEFDDEDSFYIETITPPKTQIENHFDRFLTGSMAYSRSSFKHPFGKFCRSHRSCYGLGRVPSAPISKRKKYIFARLRKRRQLFTGRQD